MEETRVIFKDRLIELVRETVETLGFVCIEARLNLQKGGGTLRVIIFNRDRNVSMEDCSTVSNVILRRIGLEHPDFAENFDLVVESPGAERRFENLEEMLLFEDRDIRLVLRDPARFGLKDNVLVGRVSRTDSGNPGEFLFRTADGRDFTIPWIALSQARLNFDVKKYL